MLSKKVKEHLGNKLEKLAANIDTKVNQKNEEINEKYNIESKDEELKPEEHRVRALAITKQLIMAKLQNSRKDEEISDYEMSILTDEFK